MEQPLRFRAILSRTTTDQVKSKVLSPDLCQLVLDCYLSPSEFAQLLEQYFEKEFVVEVKDEG
ncbi:MAG: hypothetical protein H5T92_00145 [Synergistales bacterium]|nr:hypothetical protein [Synergistales bacterium]